MSVQDSSGGSASYKEAWGRVDEAIEEAKAETQRMIEEARRSLIRPAGLPLGPTPAGRSDPMEELRARRRAQDQARNAAWGADAGPW